MPAIDVIISTGGTGFTGRDVTPEALEPLFEKRMDGFATLFLLVSHAKIGTSAIQTRATAGVAGATYIFCLPGSPGACRDAWDEILRAPARLPLPPLQLRRDHAAARRASAPGEGAGMIAQRLTGCVGRLVAAFSGRDLVRKPVSTFRDHALEPPADRRLQISGQRRDVGHRVGARLQVRLGARDQRRVAERIDRDAGHRLGGIAPCPSAPARTCPAR